jgi:hypothetical protein
VKEQLDPMFINTVQLAWVRLIRKVSEVGLPICPHCGGKMRLFAVIEEALVIERILHHLKMCDS